MAKKATKVNGVKFKKGNKAAEKWTEEKALKLGADLIKWLKKKDENGEDEGNILYEEFLVIENDLYPEIIAYLTKKYPSFLKLAERAKKIQEVKLKKYGIMDRLNVTMAKFILSADHGMSEKQEIDHTTKGESLNEKPDLSKLSSETLKAIDKELNADNT